MIDHIDSCDEGTYTWDTQIFSEASHSNAGSYKSSKSKQTPQGEVYVHLLDSINSIIKATYLIYLSNSWEYPIRSNIFRLLLYLRG